MALTFRTGSGGKGSALTIDELDNNFRHFTGSHAVTGSFTVSGSLNVVNTISGSSLVIDYDNVGGYAIKVSSSNSHQTSVLIQSLPTNEPLVTGSLWLSGSGVGAASGSKYLLVFNG
tara:strand:- start:845 stop:1195 length:351 start_codon:yes stop_codon:yes gene_type:complete